MLQITVFGGSQPKPGDNDYKRAHQLGGLLGERGYTVRTGGYIGTMEAVSRGASEAGSHVIGVTCADIEAWRPVGANHWVKEEIRVKTIPERIVQLIKSCDAALALPGGVGTLTEIMLTWNLLLTESISARPLILIGSIWKNFIDKYILSFQNYIPESQRGWILSVENVDEAMQQLQEILSDGKV